MKHAAIIRDARDIAVHHASDQLVRQRRVGDRRRKNASEM
jgi:hypothetical protein